MIGPLGQRQVHMVSNVEAMRQALDAGDQQTRELARKRAADERMAEASQEVPLVSGPMGLRTEERKGRQREQGWGGEEAPEEDGEGGEAEGGPSGNPGANPAEGHLDFLA